ncbi:YaeQ family protein [Demequina zhanjiangensis]|uniref:YaeQ family protein n=1 Tax=Demequina zhanjiangensis TaxID=3051659 RepID=A0ABT8G4W7_9MICO|nr:YaeQ family protein [Demequina sp. SYSU T00b26]MDN4474102.1 YaeQ family protein [Demequina sp. SYSU T00b26]
MAAGATVHTFEIELADVDRGVYESLSLRVARHPSETAPFMLTRVLAYCLEFEEGIDFGQGISGTEEPAVMVRDLTGRITVWIEIGAPEAERLHRGSRLADRTAVYTHRDPQKVLSGWEGKRIHQREQITLTSFDPGFIEAAAARLERRSALSVSVTEGHLYLEVDGVASECVLERRMLG